MLFKFVKSCVPLLVLAAIPAFAAPQVQMKLTGVGSNGVLGGVYVGPYNALIDNVPTAVICDDFSAETFVNQMWTAEVHNVGNLTSDLGETRWGFGATTQAQIDGAIAKYQQAAWLALQLSSPLAACGDANCGGDLQFAIWKLFDPSAVTAHLSSHPMPAGDSANVDHWLARAASEYQQNVGAYSSVYIYTPTTKFSPQEFLVVRAPEPGALIILMLQLGGVLGLCLLVRRRSARVS